MLTQAVVAEGCPWSLGRLCDWDCRRFYDPYGETRHVGWHPKVMEQLSDHRKFKPFLKDVRGRVAETRRDHDATTAPVLAFWCNKGRHRSVASGSLVRECLVRAGYQVWSLHLTKDTWHRGTCGGDGCPECSGGSALRERLVEEAWGCWCSV